MICLRCEWIQHDSKICPRCGGQAVEVDDLVFSATVIQIIDLNDDGDDFDDFDDLPDLEDDNGKISEEEAFEIAARVMSDEKLLDFRQSVSTLWFTCSAVQLAARHPGIGEALRARLTEIGRVMQAIISDIHPDAERLIDMGWNPKNDR